MGQSEQSLIHQLQKINLQVGFEYTGGSPMRQRSRRVKKKCVASREEHEGKRLEISPALDRRNASTK
jgi:hypothetical protein